MKDLPNVVRKQDVYYEDEHHVSFHHHPFYLSHRRIELQTQQNRFVSYHISFKMFRFTKSVSRLFYSFPVKKKGGRKGGNKIRLLLLCKDVKVFPVVSKIYSFVYYSLYREYCEREKDRREALEILKELIRRCAGFSARCDSLKKRWLKNWREISLFIIKLAYV